MIVFKYTYDTSVGEFTPTFNSGYVYTTKTSTSGTLKTVTIESDTAFTGLSWGSSSKSSITKIDLVDVSGLKSLAQVFYDFTSLTSVTVVNATTALLDINHAFYGNTALTDITLVDCDFTAVNNMSNCFNGGANSSAVNVKFSNVKFNNVSKGMILQLKVATNMKIENCDFSKTTNMSSAFADCVGLTGTLDLSTTPFSPNVTDMSTMFSGCSNLKKIIMPKGDFPLLTNMNALCFRCSNLKEIDFSNFSAKGAAITFSQTFGECPVLEEIDLSSLGAIATNCFQMAYGNPNITYSLRKVNLSGLKITSRVNFDHAFYGISTIEWFDISNFHATPSVATNFNISKDTIKNIGALYCPANVINYYANLMVNTGNVCNIYYHDAKLEDLTVDSRFNYIYCEEYHGSEVTTPDDLKMYELSTNWGNSHDGDRLDLTTGILTKKIENLIIDNATWGPETHLGKVVPNSAGTHYECKISYWFLRDTKYNGASGNPQKGIFFKNGCSLPVRVEAQYISMDIPISMLSEATIDNYLAFLDGGEIIYFLGTHRTEQLSINPLKSYYNGSIQTSSQQLAPTLKTTLPVSNKFTTTNLTSGSTYNVYFDGTATKLDAGGTIITDPVSPCEVECGGTTLTIEGTDIQNVRVLGTTNKNEVGSVCGTTDVELNAFKTKKYENLVDRKWSVSGYNWTLDEKTNTLFTNNPGRWTGIEVITGAKYPKGTSLVHVEFDVDTQDKRCAWIAFGNSVTTPNVNFRDLKLNNDTARICQGHTSGIGTVFASYISKGHFSNLLYVSPLTDGKQRNINFTIYTDSTPISGLVCNTTNCTEGSIDGYTACADTGVTISNMRIRVIENYPDDTSFSQHPSLIRQGTGQVIWQDMDMTMPYTNTYLAKPIKLRSLGTTYDSYNPVTEELTKRIGVSETDGSYSVLNSPIVTKITDSKLCRNIFDVNGEVKNWKSTPTINGNEMTFTGTYFTAIRVPKLTTGKTYTLFYEFVTGGRIVVLSDYTNQNSGIAGTDTGATWLSAGSKGIKTFIYTGASGNGAVMFWANSSGTTYKNIMLVEGKFDNYEDLPYFEDEFVLTYDNIKDGIPQLYTNGQVKVYSDSEVYPTTILNGQSTNNYEINELNKSNNYTIRYEGECESINLANKSNEQGTNRIVKSGTTRGNLTFVNDSGDIDNVLLVQNDVREQEINHFNGLQTVEVSKILIENQKNMWWNDWIAPSQYGANWQVDSPEFISVQPGETIYVVANNNNYTGLIEFDENYNIVNQGKELILSDEANPKPVNLGNNYYKNYRVLSENTRYVKFTIPASTAVGAKNETRWSVISFTRENIGNVALYTNNTPYRGSIINLPQPVQLNGLPDGTCDTYNPITGEYVQNVGYFVLDDTFASSWRVVKTKDGKPYAQRDLSTQAPHYNTLVENYSFPAKLYDYQTGTKAIANIPLVDSIDHTSLNVVTPSLYGDTYFGNYFIKIALPFTPNDINEWNYSNTQVNDWLRENPIHIVYKRTEPITTQLTPINIPTFEGGILQLITTDGKVFPMVEYSMPTNNRYDTSSWETGAVYTQRNITEAYFNESTTPMTPTETMTLTTDHISSGSIILNDNGNGLIVLKGNYTGRDIPYFTGMRSVEAIEVETTPSPDQPLFGKGGRK